MRLFNSFRVQLYSIIVLIIAFTSVRSVVEQRAYTETVNNQELVNIVGLRRSNALLIATTAESIAEAQDEAERQNQVQYMNDLIASFDAGMNVLHNGDGRIAGIQHSAALPLLNDLDSQWAEYRELARTFEAGGVIDRFTLLNTMDAKSLIVFTYADRLSQTLVTLSEQQIASLTQFRNGFLILVAIILTGIYFVINNMVRSVNRLASTAEQLGQGDYTARAESGNIEEIARVARSFNFMGEQVQQAIETVETRSRYLETTVEVGDLVTRLNNQEELLAAVTDFIRSRFNLYYTQIYLLDETKRFALLRAGTGSVGQQLLGRNHKLDTDGTSLVASAVQSRQSVLVSNTTASEVHLPNPLLPDTKSEVAIPLQVGDEVIGVLDMQAAQVNTFNEDNLSVFEAMASQLASALYGARAYTEIQTAIERAERLNERITSQNWTSYLGSLSEQGQVQYEFDVYGTDKIRLLDEQTSLHDIALDMQDKQSLSQAVHLGGQSIGRILIREERERNWTNEERALVADAAQRLAQAAEQFRAFDETEAARKLSATLFSVGQHLAAADSMEDILDAISTPEILSGAISTTLFTIEVDEAGKPEWLVASAIYGQTPVKLGDRFYLPEFPFAKIWLTSQTEATFISDVHSDERVDANTRNILQQFGTPAITVLPLSAGGRWAGLLNTSWTTVQQFKPAQKELYQALIAPIATALNNLLLFGQTQQRAAESQTLYRVGQELAAANSMDEILQAIATPEIVGDAVSTSLFVFEFDEAGHPADLVTAATTGNSITPVGSRFKLSEFGIAKIWMSSQTNALLIGDIHADERVDDNTRAIMDQIGTPALITLPLAVGGRWAGLVTASWGTVQQFKLEDKALYQALIAPIATALNNLLLLDETQKRATESATLYRVGQQLAAADSMEEILSAVSTSGILGEGATTTLYTFEFDEAGNPEWLIVAAIYGQAYINVGDRFRMSDFTIAEIWMSDQKNALLIGDTGTDERVDANTRSMMEQFGTPSLVTLPLTSGRRWVGLLVTQWTSKQNFNADQKAIYQALISPISTAINNLQLLDQTQKRAVEMETVAQVGTVATSTLDMTELLQSVTDLTKSQFKLYHTHIYLLDEAHENLVLTAGAGEVGKIMQEKGHRIPFNNPRSLVASAARNRKGVVVDDVTQAPDFLPNPLLPDTRSEMAVPMIVGDDVIGVLDAQAVEIARFDRNDVQVFTALASQVAVAVENARAFEREHETVQRLQEIDQLKSQFLANMSHELRTPLNSIIGYAGILAEGAEGDLPEEALTDINIIHESGKHLLSIINDILDLAKIEAREMKLRFAPVELPKILDEVVRSGQVLANAKNVALQLVQESEVPNVNADMVRMRQVTWNLVSNALKFTEKGSVTVRYGMLNEREMFVRIEDTGIGIPADFVNQVFERFRQVDETSTRAAGGTGLGLTITRELIHLHGGEIYAESEFGVGSTFWFRLPIAITEGVAVK